MTKTHMVKKPKLVKTPSSETTTTTPTIKPKTLKKVKIKKLKVKQKPPIPSPPKTLRSDSDSDSDSDSVDLPSLLDPFTRDQLVHLITAAAAATPSLYSLIRDHADRDVSRRKIFVHGFSRDTTREDLVSAFSPFGEIEDCNVVSDKATGKAKGYGFVTFKARKAAVKALRDPQKKINDRIASCQLASVGATGKEGKEGGQEVVGARKIYVSNVPGNAEKEKLRALFAKFGEIENGPMGFDHETGKSKGYALFVYKTVEGARKALEEPHKVFEGQILLCSKAADGKSKNFNTNNNQVVGQVGGQQQQQGQVLAAVAAAQNLALFGQHPGLNPMYNGYLGNPGGVAGIISPVMGGAVSQAVVPTSQVGGLGVGSQSVFGGYKIGQGLQHAYPNSQIGQAGVGKGQGAGGSFSGYPSYM